MSTYSAKASEIKKQSAKEGFSWITVKRAKKKLPVDAKQSERAWWWNLRDGSLGTVDFEEIGSDNPSDDSSDNPPSDPKKIDSFVF
jgi:hypothetical protein